MILWWVASRCGSLHLQKLTHASLSRNKDLPETCSCPHSFSYDSPKNEENVTLIMQCPSSQSADCRITCRSVRNTLPSTS